MRGWAFLEAACWQAENFNSREMTADWDLLPEKLLNWILKNPELMPGRSAYCNNIVTALAGW